MDEAAPLAPPAPAALAGALALAVAMPLIGFMVGVVWLASGGARVGAGSAVLLASGVALTAMLALLGAGGY